MEAVNSDGIIWKSLSVKFVFNSAKVAPQWSYPPIEPAKMFRKLIFRTHPQRHIFLIKFYPYGIGPAAGNCAYFFHLFRRWLRQSASLAPLAAHPHWCPWPNGSTLHLDAKLSIWSKPGLQAFKQKHESRQSSWISFFLTPNCLVKLTVF